MIHVKKTNIFSKNFKRVLDLYDQSFPVSEKIPRSELKLTILRKNNELLEIYDDDIFIGFAYMYHYNNYHYLQYFAIDPNVRSKGYGSLFLQNLINKYNDDIIVLDIEILDKNTDNYEQRISRLHFYEKNNFQLTNYILEVEGTEKYNILTNNINSFDIKQYNQGYKKFAGKKFTFTTYNQT